MIMSNGRIISYDNEQSEGHISSYDNERCEIINLIPGIEQREEDHVI